MTRDQFLTEVMGEIRLTNGMIALIDPEDYKKVSKYSWTMDSRGYVRSWWRRGKRKGVLYLHRLIMETPPHMHTDHKNRNRLDNRKSNLRICSAQQNYMNRPKFIVGKVHSRYKGVTLSYGKYWKAQISHNNKTIHIGLFKTQEDAAIAYNGKATELYGEFAFLNEVTK